jgi:hypothetical protein
MQNGNELLHHIFIYSLAGYSQGPFKIGNWPTNNEMKTWKVKSASHVSTTRYLKHLLINDVNL